MLQSQLCQYEGSWSEGEFVDGRVLMKDGSTYKGTFKESVADVCSAKSGI